MPPRKITKASKEITVTVGKADMYVVKVGGIAVGQLSIGHIKGTTDDQWDTGVFEIKDGTLVVGRLWVRKNANSLKTEFWGLSASYEWPSASATNKTFNYYFRSDLGYNASEQQLFKDDCNAAFPNQVVTFLQCDPVAF